MNMTGFRASPVIKMAIEKAAKKRGVTVAEWLREAVSAQLNQEARVEQFNKTLETHMKEVENKLAGFETFLHSILEEPRS